MRWRESGTRVTLQLTGLTCADATTTNGGTQPRSGTALTEDGEQTAHAVHLRRVSVHMLFSGSERHSGWSARPRRSRTENHVPAGSGRAALVTHRTCCPESHGRLGPASRGRRAWGCECRTRCRRRMTDGVRLSQPSPLGSSCAACEVPVRVRRKLVGGPAVQKSAGPSPPDERRWAGANGPYSMSNISPVSTPMRDPSALELSLSPQARSRNVGEPLRNYDQAAAWLGVARGWLEAEVQAGRVSHTRLGKHVRFTQEHLDELVARGERRASTPDSVAPPPSLPVRTPRPLPGRQRRQRLDLGD
jgi:excisionase family DNA binding protein